MKILSALFVVLTVTLVCWTDYRLDKWERTLAEYEAQILHGQTPVVAASKQTFDELPACVQNYLRTVVPAEAEHGVESHSSVSIDQKGWIDHNSRGRWTPFTAHELLSPVGYSWEGKISTSSNRPSWWPRIRLADAYANERGGYSKAAILAIFKVKNLFQGGGSNHLVSMEHAMRWLADSPLIPTVLLPEAGIVTWTAIEDSPDKALLSLQFAENDSVNARPRLDMEATFSQQEEGWMTSLVGNRLVLTKDLQLRLQSWQVNLGDYQEEEHGMWVPRYLEHGWVNKDGPNIYFKAENNQLHYHPTNSEGVSTSEIPATAQE